MRYKITHKCPCNSAFCMRIYKACICSKDTTKLEKMPLLFYKKDKCIGAIVNSNRNRTGCLMIIKTNIDRMIKENMDLIAKICHEMLINGNCVPDYLFPSIKYCYKMGRLQNILI